MAEGGLCGFYVGDTVEICDEPREKLDKLTPFRFGETTQRLTVAFK